MREIVIVDVAELHLHSAPGGNETAIGVSKKDSRLPLLERVPSEGRQAEWVKVRAIDGKPAFLALRNKMTRESFAHVEQVATPKPPVVEPYPTSFWEMIPDWLKFVLFIGGFLALIFGGISLFE